MSSTFLSINPKTSWSFKIEDGSGTSTVSMSQLEKSASITVGTMLAYTILACIASILVPMFCMLITMVFSAIVWLVCVGCMLLFVLAVLRTAKAKITNGLKG